MSASSTPSASPQLNNNNNNKRSFGSPTNSDLEITTQWAHYDNLHKLCAEAGTGKKKKQLGGICGLFNHRVTITEKIDGSNLGMWVRHNPKINADRRDVDSYEVLLLQGRNQPIFRKKGFDEFAERQAKIEKEKNKQTKINEDDESQQENPPFDEATSKKLRAALEDDLLFMSTCLPQYGNAKILGKLIYKMRIFCAKIAIHLDLPEVEIFGEAFRAKYLVDNPEDKTQKIEKIAAFSSWHPFGFKTPSSNWELTRLTASTHELFSRFSILGEETSSSSLPKNHVELMSLLANAKDHTVFPPVLYAANVALIDGVQSVISLIVSPPSPLYFEGCFIVSESGDFGTKFKTATFEEQKRLPSLKDVGIYASEEEMQAALAEQQKILSINPDAATKFSQVIDPVLMKRIKSVYMIMTQVFKTKEQEKEEGKQLSSSYAKAGVVLPATQDQQSTAAPDMNWNKTVAVMNDDIKTACERELGKRLSFAHFPVESEERQKVMENLCPLVVKEVLEIYEESDKRMPYTKEALMKRSVAVVKNIVQAVPYEKL